MLTEEYIVSCSDNIVKLYNNFVDEAIKEIAKSLKSYYSFDEINRKAELLILSGELRETIVKKIAKLTRKSQKEVSSILSDAGKTTISYDDAIYTKEGFDVIPFTASKELRQILETHLASTNGELYNLTKTTADKVQKEFIKAVDNAELQVQSGYADYNSAIKNAVYDIIDSGGGTEITYSTSDGKIHKSQLDVAVRRAVLTGVSLTANEMQVQRAKEMKAPYVDTSAHEGARPTHAEWQGKRFKFNDFMYKPFGTENKSVYEQLKDYNCRHSWYPVMDINSPKARTDKTVKEINKKTVESKGKTYTYFEAEQRLRYMERTIRKYKRRAMALEEQGLDSTHDRAKVREWQKHIREFVKDTGLKRRPENEQVLYFTA